MVSVTANKTQPRRALLSVTACGRCERPLASEELVAWVRHTRRPGGRWMLPGAVCGDCARGDLGNREEWYPPRPCLGCGRPVSDPTGMRRVRFSAREGRPEYSVVSGIPLPPGLRALCSAACRSTYYSRVRTGTTAEARHKVCPLCGETFDATRRDAVTCSPACRQQAYRRRRAITASPSGTR